MTINSVGPATNLVATAPPEQVAQTAQTTQAAGNPPVANSASVSATQSQQAATKPTTEPSLEQLEKATKLVQEMVQSKASSLVFSLDQDTGKAVVKVVDSHTQAVIRQIPSEEMLAIAHALDQMQAGQGVLLKGKA